MQNFFEQFDKLEDGFKRDKIEINVFRTKDKIFTFLNNSLVELPSCLISTEVAPQIQQATVTQSSVTQPKKRTYKKCVICTDDCKISFKKNTCGCIFHLKCIKQFTKENKCKCGESLYDEIITAMNSKRGKKKTQAQSEQKMEIEASFDTSNVTQEVAKEDDDLSSFLKEIENDKMLEGLESLDNFEDSTFEKSVSVSKMI